MDVPWVDILKIAVTVASCISLIYFRRSIVKAVTDIIIGGDTSRYTDKTASEIVAEVDSRLNEVLR